MVIALEAAIKISKLQLACLREHDPPGGRISSIEGRAWLEKMIETVTIVVESAILLLKLCSVRTEHNLRGTVNF